MATMISYSRNDWDRVGPVVSFLKQNGLTIWLDQDEIQPNADWRRELLQTPRQVKAFVPFLSKSYVNSEMCRMELFLARSFDRPIFPVMLEECWALLDSKEETKYLAGIFAARLEALKLVGIRTTQDVILNRLLRAIQIRLSNTTKPVHNVYISYPNGAAEVAVPENPLDRLPNPLTYSRTVGMAAMVRHNAWTLRRRRRSGTVLCHRRLRLR